MDAHSTVTAEEGDRYPLKPPSKGFIMHMAKYLIELFVDGTPLSITEFAFLQANLLIEEVSSCVWQLTQNGRELLKN